MKYYYVNVQDRQTGEVVTVGAMLTLAECRELIGILQKYNATDLLIYKCEETFLFNDY